MSQNNDTKEVKNDETKNIDNFDIFVQSHELQLFSVQFPKELQRQLYDKLKGEIFDIDDYFEIIDNQDEKRYLLRAKKPIKKNGNVFLIDHAWTFKIRQFRYFCENYPKIIKRAATMLKYAPIKKKIIDLSHSEEKKENKNIDSYNKSIENNYELSINLDYDEMNLKDEELENKLKITENTITLSIENNEIKNIYSIYKLLDKFKNIKALWCRDNPFCDVVEGYESIITERYKNIEILNRKLTKSSSEWAISFLLKNDEKYDEETFKIYNCIYGREKTLDLSGRDPLAVSDLSIYKKKYNFQISGIDISDNEYDFSEKNIREKFFEFLKALPKSNEFLFIDEDFDIFKENESPDEDNYSFFMDKEILENIEKLSNIKYINNLSISSIKANISSTKSLCTLLTELFVYRNIWSLTGTYRLLTEDSFEEDSNFYLNDEFGAAINHSDRPNCSIFPLVYSSSGKFKRDELISYSILWVSKDINVGEEAFVDFLANNDESQQRSSRLTVWYDTPKCYFENKFKEKMKKYNKANESKSLDIFREKLQNLLSYVKEGKNISDQMIEDVFNFNLIEDKSIIPETKKKIREALNNDNSKEYNNKKYKVYTDLGLIKKNLHLENFQLCDKMEDADIVWLTKSIYDFLEYNPNFKFKKDNIYINQYPYESIITMKSKLADLLQSNLGLSGIMQISYFLNSELAEVIGNYYYNENNNLDNTWIIKPINMSRSLDMLITNNLNAIIRAVDGGPKICQKYLINPFLLHSRKFDLRFIISLRSLLPLNILFYEQMFWVRSANKEFSREEMGFDDYEKQFTVMNYSKFGMRTIKDKEFKEELEKLNIIWSSIYSKIKSQVHTVFELALKDCPCMINYYSRAIYGLDVLIDSDLNPHILEINYQPDCTRACNFEPHFYDHVFEALFGQIDHNIWN